VALAQYSSSTPEYTGLTGPALLAVRLASVVASPRSRTSTWANHPARRALADATTLQAVHGCRGDRDQRSVFRRDGQRPPCTQRGHRPGRPTGGDRRRTEHGGCLDTRAPVRGAGDRGPVKVLVVGDSQGATLGRGLDASPGSHVSPRSRIGGVEPAILAVPSATASSFVITAIGSGTSAVATAPGNGSGVRRRRVRHDVVVGPGPAWDLYDSPAGRLGGHPGDPTWNTSYTNDVKALLRHAGRDGAVVVADPPAVLRNDGGRGRGAHHRSDSDARGSRNRIGLADRSPVARHATPRSRRHAVPAAAPTRRCVPTAAHYERCGGRPRRRDRRPGRAQRRCHTRTPGCGG